MKIIAYVHSPVKMWQDVILVASLKAMNETLGEMIVRLRTARGWTQEELAARSGLKQPTVADIERGRSKLPGPEIRRGIADALGVRHLDLLIAAGQLTPNEIEPLHESTIVDFRLREIIDAWPDITPQAQEHLHSLLRVPGIVVREEPQVARMAR